MARRTLLLIASILVAALGTALIWLYVQGADARAEAGQAQVQVLVATADTQAGMPAADVRWARQPLPQNFVASLGQSVLTDPSQLSGFTQTQIVRGLPLVAGQFAGRPAAAPPSVTGLGGPEVGMMVTLPDPQRLSGLLQTGTQIRVYAAVQQPGGKTKGVVTLFNKIRVLATPTTAPPSGSGASAIPQANVLLALTPDQARTLAFAQFQGGGNALWFGLLGSRVPDDGPATLTAVQGGH